jgi:hypothetical protein
VFDHMVLNCHKHNDAKYDHPIQEKKTHTKPGQMKFSTKPCMTIAKGKEPLFTGHLLCASLSI